MDCHVAYLLLRVRGPSLGYRPTRGAVYGVRCQVPRKVQGPAERGLLAKWVIYFIYIYKYIFIFLIDRSWIPCLLNFDTRFYSKWGEKNGRFVFTKCVKFLYVNIIYKKIEGIYVINCVGNECIWILQSWSYISYMFYNLLKYL